MSAENKTAKTPTDGGAAFPVAHSHLIQSGMSLRDYFAGKAMQVILRSYDIASSFEDSEVNDPEGMPTLIAIDAYVMADAMLKARER
jgi:hypothetical protein